MPDPAYGVKRANLPQPPTPSPGVGADPSTQINSYRIPAPKLDTERGFCHYRTMAKRIIRKISQEDVRLYLVKFGYQTTVIDRIIWEAVANGDYISNDHYVCYEPKFGFTIVRRPRRSNIFLGGSWTPEEGFQPLEQVSAYSPEFPDSLVPGNP
jgi:hypothetical protein